MVIGVGTDLVEIQRMEKACQKESFLAYTFTDQERRQAKESISSLAGDFAVKESVAKALGTGFRGFGPKDIEALRDELGKPYVKLYGGAAKRAKALGIGDIQVSITNTREYAAAFVVAQTEGKTEAAIAEEAASLAEERSGHAVFADGETGEGNGPVYHGAD